LQLAKTAKHHHKHIKVKTPATSQSDRHTKQRREYFRDLLMTDTSIPQACPVELSYHLQQQQQHIFVGCAWRLGLAVQWEIILDSLELKDLEKLNLGSNHQASSRVTYSNFANAEIKWNSYFKVTFQCLGFWSGHYITEQTWRVFEVREENDSFIKHAFTIVCISFLCFSKGYWPASNSVSIVIDKVKLMHINQNGMMLI